MASESSFTTTLPPPPPPAEQSLAASLNMAQPPSESRLSMPTPVRIPVAGFTGFGIGYALGLIEGSRNAALRFRAEHAHKMPSSTTGWFLYHKSKNYHTMFGGLKEGLRMGGRLGFWTILTFSLESTVDRSRGKSDLLSTVLASLTVAGSFSLWNRFSLPTAARTARYGLIFGVVFGGLQDAVGLARGRPVSYVDYFRAKFAKPPVDRDVGGSSSHDGVNQAENLRTL